MADLIDAIIEAVTLNIDGRDWDLRLKYARQAVMEQIRAAPLTDILDALGHPYRKGLVPSTWRDGPYVYVGDDRTWPDDHRALLAIVDNPATDEEGA